MHPSVLCLSWCKLSWQGAGTGLIGLAAAHVCAPAELVLTDVESHVDLLKLNAANNPVPGCNIKVEAYHWGQESPIPGSSSSNSSNSNSSNSSNSGSAFDVILGGDLAYNPGLYGPLVNALETCSDAHTVTYLGVTRSDTTQGFFKLLHERGFEFYRLPDWETEGKGNTGDVQSYGLFVIFKERPAL